MTQFLGYFFGLILMVTLVLGLLFGLMWLGQQINPSIGSLAGGIVWLLLVTAYAAASLSHGGKS